MNLSCSLSAEFKETKGGTPTEANKHLWKYLYFDLKMRERGTGGNNQESGMTSDRGHEMKGMWPETRRELDFQNKTGNSRDRKPRRDKTSPLCDINLSTFCLIYLIYSIIKYNIICPLSLHTVLLLPICIFAVCVFLPQFPLQLLLLLVYFFFRIIIYFCLFLCFFVISSSVSLCHVYIWYLYWMYKKRGKKIYKQKWCWHLFFCWAPRDKQQSFTSSCLLLYRCTVINTIPTIQLVST